MLRLNRAMTLYTNVVLVLEYVFSFTDSQELHFVY